MSCRPTRLQPNRSGTAIERAAAILQSRGEQPRILQNRLVFLAADYDIVSRLKDQVRTLLAWESIVADVKILNLGQYQPLEAERGKDNANAALKRLSRGATAGCSSSPNGRPDVMRRFCGSLEIDPQRAVTAFADVVDEVFRHFTQELGVRVRIRVDVEAETDASGGFDESLQRTVRENCRVLRFAQAEFERSDS